MCVSLTFLQSVLPASTVLVFKKYFKWFCVVTFMVGRPVSLFSFSHVETPAAFKGHAEKQCQLCEYTAPPFLLDSMKDENRPFDAFSECWSLYQCCERSLEKSWGAKFNSYSWEWSLRCGTSPGETVKTEVIYIEMRVMKAVMTTETYTTISQNNLSLAHSAVPSFQPWRRWLGREI